MYRKIDKEGRICIPSEFRNKINLGVDTEVKIELIDNKIIITNSQKEDTFKEIENKLKLLTDRNEKTQEEIIDEILENIKSL